VITLILLAPFFIGFELWQLIWSERYLGIKQITRGADPRTLGLREFTAFCWVGMIVLYWGWMLLLLATPIGRVHGLGLMAVSLIGFSVRRGIGHKGVLVALTFEGAFRIGILLMLFVRVWQGR